MSTKLLTTSCFAFIGLFTQFVGARKASRVEGLLQGSFFKMVGNYKDNVLMMVEHSG